MITIYHNSRCSKSREGVSYLENLKVDFEIVNYFDTKLSFNDLKKIIEILNINAIDLVRVKEAIWKENFKDKNLLESEIIQAMVDYPKLIERPIVINGTKGIVARPFSLIDSII